MSPIPYSSPSLRAFVLSVLVVSVGLIQSNSGYAQKQLDFNYTGRVQLWTVPSCVQKIKVEVWGAQGGGSYECDENGPSVLQDDVLRDGRGVQGFQIPAFGHGIAILHRGEG